MSLKGDLRKAAERSPADLFFLIYTFIWLGIIRIAIESFSFQRICVWVGLKNGDDTQGFPAASDIKKKYIQRVGWAVNVAAYRTPWQSACLARAITSAVLLKQKDIPAALYLGVSKTEDGNGISAHAWLRCNGEFITGEGGHERFKVIAAFNTMQ